MAGSLTLKEGGAFYGIIRENIPNNVTFSR
jgi:hypothetical protein